MRFQMRNLLGLLFLLSCGDFAVGQGEIYSSAPNASLFAPPPIDGRIDYDLFLDSQRDSQQPVETGQYFQFDKLFKPAAFEAIDPSPISDPSTFGQPSVGMPAFMEPPVHRRPIGPQEVGHQFLPDGLIYTSYLAGVKESRFSLHMIDISNDGWMLDATLGQRLGIYRYGTYDQFRPEGFQIDIEGSAQLRLQLPEEVDVRSADFRAGVPLTWGYGQHQTKLAYYHLSSHVGDEYLIKNPGFTRLNFARDVFVLGQSYYWNDNLRVYGEAGWAFYSDVAKEWEFQVGIEQSPAGPTGVCGEPFFALNGHFREEVNFGGNLTFQAGWAWRNATGRMLRTGLHYYNGESNHFSFHDEFEQQIGFGLWYEN